MTCRPFGTSEALASGFLNRVVTEQDLDASVDELAGQLAGKASYALLATKRHVNAVTEQMVGTMRSWSDADGLLVALGDDECIEARERYIEERAAR